MKFWFTFFLIIAVFIVLFYPLVNRERVCYETASTNLDSISVSVVSRNVPHELECSQTTDELWNLETCIRDATKSSTVATYANDFIQRMVAMIRPYTKSLWSLKAEHNMDCSEFNSAQLP